jgi:hypothetical protein
MEQVSVASKELSKRLFSGSKEVRMCCNILREEFGELSQLKERGVGVGWEIMLRERSQPIELRAMRLKKFKVGT